MALHHSSPLRLGDVIEVEKARVVFRVTSSVRGHAHVEHTGTYTGAATSDLVAKTYYHPVFGGRRAWASGGRWGCIVHVD